MFDHFEPQNPIEEKLVAAQNGEMDGEQFMQELLQAELFMPILEKENMGGIQNSKAATPLSLTDENGVETIILFTSPERAKEFVRDHPGYGGGLLAEMTWILERVGSGHGISLNPNWPAGIDMEPGMVDSLRQ